MGKRNLKSNITMYLRWPIIIGVYLLIVSIIIYMINPVAGRVLLGFVALYYIYAIYISMTKTNSFYIAIQKLAEENAKAQGFYLSKINMPYAVLSVDGKVLWGNEAFADISNDLTNGKKIKNIFPEISDEFLKNLTENEETLLTSYDNKYYKLFAKKVTISITNDNSGTNNKDGEAVFLYLDDQTEYYNIKQEYDDSKQVTGYIYIDNFDEVIENMEDSKGAMLIAMVDRKLTRYISYNSSIIKKLEKDKYFFVTTKKNVEDMIKDRFSILDESKDILGEDNIPLTLSIGVGYGGKSLETNNEYAKVAMDMALGRGGDQAVVKNGSEISYHGGKSVSTASNMRVRSRVKATSFKETLNTKDTVLIIGHRHGDLDSFGASIGTYVMAKHMGKDAHIVVNEVTNAVSEVKKGFIDNENYPNDMFIDGDKALAISDENTLICMVDHNQATISDEPRLFDKALDIVIFDHHRVSENSISDAVLTYIEPGASSTCELVSEIMNYFDDRLKIKPLEADALLSGIMLDTVYFSYHTSAKTFDAASFLRKKGADMDRVRKLFRLDKLSEKTKNEVIENAEYYKDTIAIAVIEDTDGIETNVIKAEIANELVNIKGVRASVVISKDGDKYALSSRSVDELNVQVLMEKLGGGGHHSQAGAMIDADSFEDAKNKVKAVIDEMLEEEK